MSEWTGALDWAAVPDFAEKGQGPEKVTFEVTFHRALFNTTKCISLYVAVLAAAETSFAILPLIKGLKTKKASTAAIASNTAVM